jgi:protocatechuate 3,4-dioxygenase beta subunit
MEETPTVHESAPHMNDFTTTGPETRSHFSILFGHKTMRNLGVLAVIAFTTVCPGQVTLLPRGGVITVSRDGVPLPDAPASNEKKASIEGSVLSSSGDPLRKVSITLQRSDPSGDSTVYSVTTDAAGRFRIAELIPGRYFISWRRPGYIPTIGKGRGQGWLTLSPGQELKDHVLKMMAQAVMTGKITDEDGDPMQHVGVQLLASRYQRGKKQMTPIGGAATNDLGEYRLSNIAPGKYYVTAQPQTSFDPPGSIQPATDKPDLGYSSVYYPNAQDLAQSTMVELKAGAELRGVDFHVSKVPLYRIRG